MVINACYTLGDPSIRVAQNCVGVNFSNTDPNKCGFNRQMWLRATAELVLTLSKNVVVCYSIAIVLIS